MASHAKTLWYEEKTNGIARQPDSCYIFVQISSKPQIHFFLYKERLILFSCPYKSWLDSTTVVVLFDHHKHSGGVLS